MAQQKTPLSDDQLETYHQLLVDKRHELTGDMNRLEEAADVGPEGAHGNPSDVPTHPADAAQDLQREETDLRLAQSVRDQVAEIDEAIERIRDGSYGVCLDCDKPIQAKRLKARPWSKFCLEHARMEHG